MCCLCHSCQHPVPDTSVGEGKWSEGMGHGTTRSPSLGEGLSVSPLLRIEVLDTARRLQPAPGLLERKTCFFRQRGRSADMLRRGRHLVPLRRRSQGRVSLTELSEFGTALQMLWNLDEQLAILLAVGVEH